MKIAFISYEYPPDTAYGGIATYVCQAAKMLQQRGHYIEVFASSPDRSETTDENGILVHRIQEESRQAFPQLIGQVFAERHLKVKFDVLEGPEFNADAQEAIRLCPEIPLAVKFHTPSYLLGEIDGSKKASLLKKLRVYFAAFRKGYKPVEYWKYDLKDDIERLHALQADELVMPCRAISEKVINFWGLDIEKVSYVPNPYIPTDSLLKIPYDTNTGIVTFVGRLEARKGVIDLAQAIPSVLKKHPHTKFRFVGRPLGDMQQRLESMLKPYQDSVELTGPVPLEELPSLLANTDICVFPSLWENFPLVCLEAMAAGRGIVGSSAGGMAELLDYGEVGRLVPPHSPRDISEALIELLGNPRLRMSLGQAARNRLLTEYSNERIGELQETSYERAIKRRQFLGSRSLSKDKINLIYS